MASGTWPLLASKLRRSDSASISQAEVRRSGLDVTKLREARLVKRVDERMLHVPGCEDGCEPNWDWSSRRGEGLVGVACPNDPACWTGFKWITREELAEYQVDTKNFMERVGKDAGLSPLSAAVPRPFQPIGRGVRRGKTLAVFWARCLDKKQEITAVGFRSLLGCDCLVAVVSAETGVPRLLAPGVVVLALSFSSDGVLDLSPALDVLDPGYRQRAVADPELDLDFVHLTFATAPEEHRHILKVNGVKTSAYGQSDVGFLRLMVLAAGRAAARGFNGWRLRSVLVGDLDARPKKTSLKKAGDALDGLRNTLREVELAGLSEEERGALIKTQAGNTGKIRLAVPPENIIFDDSLESLEWVGPGTNTRRDGSRGRMTRKQRAGLEVASILLEECRHLGVPGDPDNLPPIPPA